MWMRPSSTIPVTVPDASELTLRIDDRLRPDEVHAVLDLVDAAARSDGVTPLSEHVLLHLRHGGDAHDRHVRVLREDTLVGYAHLDTTDLVEGSSAELAVNPAHRRQGVGHLLVAQLLQLSPDGRLRLWAHGGHSDAAHLARSLGFTQARVLWQMRRSLHASLPGFALPPGVRLRTFVPGTDDDEWVAVNAAAFADLPDQGAWSLEDLQRRTQESWFDPHGFLVAEATEGDDAGRMVGFHWTKIHGTAGHRDGHGHEPLGEVYVVGVDPSRRGTGLGRALVLAGLAHLRALGLSQAMLYVDASNIAAIRLYESLGFRQWDTDVLYRR